MILSLATFVTVRIIEHSIAIIDTTTSTSIRVNVDPINARTHLEQKLTRSIVVQPDLSGFPLAGYELERYFITPSAVTVTGPRSQVEELQFIPTEEIDLSTRWHRMFVAIFRIPVCHDTTALTRSPIYPR